MRKMILLLAGGVLIAGTPAVAATTVYTSLAAFTAATSVQGVDTYDDLAPSDGDDGPLTRTAGSYGYAAASPGGFYYVPMSGSDISLGTNFPEDSILLSGFTGGAFAIGGNFFNTNLSDAVIPSTVTLTFKDDSGTTTRTITGATATSFLGFVSTGPITSLTVTAATGASLYPSINNLVLAKGAVVSGVPEPTTWAMMIIGFGMVGGAMRRRGVATKVAFG